MLKIKDNVDLKELEKYGFERMYRNGDSYVKSFGKSFIEILCDDTLFCKLDSGYIRKLQFRHISSDFLEFREFLNTIYNLIKADLVEKVEE